MKKHLLLLLTVWSFSISFAAAAPSPKEEKENSARWITAAEGDVNARGAWIAFRKDVTLKRVPRSVELTIGADSKYWLWVNGELVVFEGSLKRGPRTGCGYYDVVDVAPYLHKGDNKVAILLWHFGRSGFSHEDSGRSGLYVASSVDDFCTDASWLSRVHPAYGAATNPEPNGRLSETNIRYDARASMDGWQTAGDVAALSFQPSVAIGEWGDAPWGTMEERPIPLWLFDPSYTICDDVQRRPGAERDTIIASVGIDKQFTPYINITASQAGELIDVQSDHSFHGGEINVRAEYITREGQQTYESLGWMNGERIVLILPKDVKVNEVGFRQSSYDFGHLPSAQLDGEGSYFSCDDEFFCHFWQKGINTLLVNMRDTWFDCPDRERAQWFGDATTLMGEADYVLDTPVKALMRKAILELCHWCRPTGELRAPVPGNYDGELPAQMLASIGLYGFWNYYMNTGDEATLRETYPYVKRYLAFWTTDDTGLTAERHGSWDWGDWGDNRDFRLLYAGWHYMALEAAARMADLFGYADDARGYRDTMAKVKVGYNACWNGKAYRHPTYEGATDDRVQALAVLSGIAGEDKYPAITQFLRENRHASPYMEKYVVEAFFAMGEGEYGMQRARERFSSMVNNPDYTTLFEGWGIGSEGYGGGTSNHAWSGGIITVIGSCLMGINPTTPGYGTFEVDPQFVTFSHADIAVPTAKGRIVLSYAKDKDDDSLTMNITVPRGTKATVFIPADEAGQVIIGHSRLKEKKIVERRPGKLGVVLKNGHYDIKVRP